VVARKRSGGGKGAKRLLLAAAAVGALLFAIEGGEYGTRDLMRQRQRKARLTVAIDSAQRIVDSLRRYEHRLESDAALQERIAREEFGMVRGSKELLYRLAEPARPDSARPDSARPAR
jgi:cell division protein FtsB